MEERHAERLRERMWVPRRQESMIGECAKAKVAERCTETDRQTHTQAEKKRQ